MMLRNKIFFLMCLQSFFVVIQTADVDLTSATAGRASVDEVQKAFADGFAQGFSAAVMVLPQSTEDGGGGVEVRESETRNISRARSSRKPFYKKGDNKQRRLALHPNIEIVSEEIRLEFLALYFVPSHQTEQHLEHHDAKIKCKYCDFESKRKYNTHVHLIGATNTPLARCLICEKDFVQIKNLETHCDSEEHRYNLSQGNINGDAVKAELQTLRKQVVLKGREERK